MKIKPWKHQIDAIGKSINRDSMALFMQVGTGKSLTAVNCLRIKYQKHGTLLKTLILCPPIVIQNWKKEIIANSDIPEHRILTLSGPGKKRLKLFNEAVDKYKTLVVITNYEGLLMDPLYQAFMAYGFNCMVFDESHKCKNPQSKRTKKSIKLADTARYKFILTGTPVLNTPMDLFSQYRVMDGGKSFGKNFFVFRQEYFYDRNAGMPPSKHFPDWQIRPKSMERMNAIIQETACVAKKSECLDLPPLVRKTIEIEMTPKQRKIYKDLKDDFIAYIQDKACIAQMAVTKALRLQQIVSGFLTVEGVEDGVITKGIHEFKDDPRKKALHDLLEDLVPHHKVIVWAVFKQNYEAIRQVCKDLKVAHVEITGENTQKEKENAVTYFNDDPGVRVLLGNPRSGGIGINLVSSSVCVFYSRSFSLEDDIQAEARNYRGGSEIHESITRIDLVTKDSIDEMVLNALANKQKIGHKLLSTNRALI